MNTLLILCLLQTASPADQGGSGTIFGQVTDATTDAPLLMANIMVTGTLIGTATDREGEYRLLNVPEGVQQITFSVMGYQVEVREVTVTAGGSQQIDVALDPTVLRLQDVVVTAARSQQRVEEAASAVAFLDSRDLRARAAPRLDSVLPLVPGVTMMDDQLGIRGSTGYNRGAGGRVLVLLDGVPALGGDTGNVRWDTLPAEAVRQVEVVKGAASALYGSAAMGGVVNVLTRSAHDGPSTYARLRLGTWDQPWFDEYRYQEERSWTRGAEGTLIRPIGSLGLLLSGGYETSDGYRQNGWADNTHLMMKVEGPQGGRDVWSTTGILAHQERGHFIEWKGVNEPYEVDAIVRGDWIRSTKLMLMSSWRRLLSKGAYLQVQPHIFGQQWRNHFRDNDDDARILKTAVDVQAVMSLGTGTVTIGGMVGTTGIESPMYGKPRVWEGAGYLQHEVELSRSWRFSAGSRLDLHDTEATPTRAVVSPKAALVCTPTPEVTLRMTAGKGFRAPSVAEMFAALVTSGYTVIPNLELVPETVWGGEIGGSWRPLPVVRIEASIFHNRYSSMIEGVARQDGNLQFQNVNSAVLRGVELGILASIPAGWLRGGFSYLWLLAEDDAGVPLAYRRPRSGNVTMEVVGSWWSLAADCLYGAAVTRTAIYQYERRIPMYRLDGRLTIEFLGQRLIVQGRNLTEYSWTDIERNLTPPREWVISLERSW